MGWSGDGMMFGNSGDHPRCVFLLPCLQKMDHSHILSSLMNSRASMRSILGAGSQNPVLLTPSDQSSLHLENRAVWNPLLPNIWNGQWMHS